MSVAANMHRRGACPGLSTPMPTGDGLLARLMPIGTIALDAMAGLCAAAQQHGNGILEITSRGSIQVRGLTDISAPAFADAVAQLGIAAQEGVPVITDPLAGLDPHEVVDAGALAAELRQALAAQPFTAQLAPKVSVVIDGGGAVDLDPLAADVRLCAIDAPDGPCLRVAVGGDAASAVPRGTIAIADGIDTVVRLLGEIAAHGPAARARDLVRNAEIDRPLPAPRKRADPIGRHRLHGNKVAVGIGFPFGHTPAATLNSLLRVARDAGATGVRASPGRALLVLGMAANNAAGFSAAAGRWRFVTERGDPRLRVVACPGAPICASGEIEARALAPEVARQAALLLRRDEIIHVSGCAKGCAHQGAATVTAIGRAGRCDLLVDGAAAGSCLPEQLGRRLGQLAIARVRDRHHG
jgi:precorrin-3B synthase